MASQGAAPEAGQEKAVAVAAAAAAAAGGVRSVLLKRDSLGAEDRLQRRHRVQQVRFKDLEEVGEEVRGGSPPIRASAANCARRSWPQSGPWLLLALPGPQGGLRGISTASQTSPSLQRPLRSKSSCNLTQEEEEEEEEAPCMVGHSQDPPLRGTTSLPAPIFPPAVPDAQQCPRSPATLCPKLPPPRGPCPPYPGHGVLCPSASCSFQHKPCAPSSIQPFGPSCSCSSSGDAWLCPPPLCQTPSEQALRAPPSAPQRGIPSPCLLAQGSPTKDPIPTFLLPTAGHPKSGKPAAESLSTTQALPMATMPSQTPPSGHSCPPETGLFARPGEMLPCIQDHLQQLVSVAPGPPCPSAGGREPPPASQDLPGRVGDLHSQLQSLEGVLETSQRTIQVLLDVIQDLEKKEAQREGRQNYWTGQDTTRCGTCRDCACIIYSVEHDFRKQEGCLQQVLSTIEPVLSHRPPQAMRAATPPSHQDASPALSPPAGKAEPKKSRRRCFWFL